jgi:hypothetical protein
MQVYSRPDYASVGNGYDFEASQANRTSLHISRRIRFSGEMWLNRLDDRPQGNSQTIAAG